MKIVRIFYQLEDDSLQELPNPEEFHRNGRFLTVGEEFPFDVLVETGGHSPPVVVWK